MTKHNKKKHSVIAVILLFLAMLIVVGGIFGYDFLEKYTHPIKYQNYVERYAIDNNIDKYLVYAVIKTESSFEPTAVSEVGARGLMQIMQPTFDWVKYRLGDEESEWLDMYDPEINIKYGCWLIGWLCQEFDDVDTAMAAYHAGSGRVGEWLADKEYSSDGIHLDIIPLSDTAHYVSKINKALETYRKLYE